jgi:hypothetical protein
LDGKFLFSKSNLKFFKYYLSILKVNRAKQSKATLILIQHNLQQAWHLK